MTDRFTVMSLDLQPDWDQDGSTGGSGDPLWIGPVFKDGHWLWHGGIADARLYASALPPGGVAALLEPLSDADGDGLSAREEHALGTHPLRPDSDFDGLSETNELATGTSPSDPDTDGDLAVDSIDPEPLVFNCPTNVLACCANTWLFHVHNALSADGTGCLLQPPAAESWLSARFPVTVTLDAPVPAPGAVLRAGGVPLVLRDPGSWTVWLEKDRAQHLWLCRQRDFPADYAVSSDAPGFIFGPSGAAAGPPPASGVRREGAAAVPSPLAVEPDPACFHGRPVTFTAKGCAAGLSGTYTWTYGYTVVVTNAPHITFAPSASAQRPAGVSVGFMPDLAPPAPAAATGGGGFAPLSAGPPGWPAGGGGVCAYCSRSEEEVSVYDVWWCERTASGAGSPCPASGSGHIPPVNGTNTWRTLPVGRRIPAPAWPGGGASFSPWPAGRAASGVPPPPSGAGGGPPDCGHGGGMPELHLGRRPLAPHDAGSRALRPLRVLRLPRAQPDRAGRRHAGRPGARHFRGRPRPGRLVPRLRRQDPPAAAPRGRGPRKGRGARHRHGPQRFPPRPLRQVHPVQPGHRGDVL
jgi:hypothetical protein